MPVNEVQTLAHPRFFTPDLEGFEKRVSLCGDAFSDILLSMEEKTGGGKSAKSAN